MAHFNMPLHVQAPENEYIMDNHYHDNGMTSPHDLGPWMDDQSDGGGKFRLKRRRRCGQCGPCQVKENCGKCQYCMRKDVLKQACIYRKCVYLRKPVPRFRPETASNSASSGGGTIGASSGGGGGAGAPSVSSASSNTNSNSTDKNSPQKPSTPSAVTNHNTQPTPSPYNPSAAAAAAVAAAQTAELSSCQLAQNPFGLPMNNGVIDPLRGSALDQPRNPLFDSTSMLDTARNAYLPGSRALESGRSPALDLGRNTNTADSGFGTGSSMTTSPANSVTKDRPAVPPVPHREQFRSPMEQWGAIPYGFPRSNPWAHPAFQHNPAAAYGFQSNANHYASPFSSSCRLGMPDPTGHLAASSQTSFHHNMPFGRPDFSAHATFRAPAPSMQPTMTPPFYPPPPHIPSSLPNFPSFNQLPSSAGHHAAYPMAHPPMYPGNFYSSFRPPTEPQIYHVQLPPPNLPFMHSHRFRSTFLPFPRTRFSFDKGDENGDSEEDEESLKKKFSIFRIPSKKQACDVNRHDPEHSTLTKSAAEELCMQRNMNDLMPPKDHESNTLLPTESEAVIDDDLWQQMNRISGRIECISVDDFKMHAFIRSDGFNNLEIEIRTPSSEAACCNTQCAPNLEGQNEKTADMCSMSDQEDMNNNLSEIQNINDNSSTESMSVNPEGLEDEHSDRTGADCVDLSTKDKLCLDSCTEKEGDNAGVLLDENQSGSQRVISELDNVTVVQTDQNCRHSLPQNDETSSTLPADVVVCVYQEGDAGVTELEVPGSQVRLEDVCLHDDLITTSSDPQDLLRCISQLVTPPSSPDVVFQFEFDRDPSTVHDYDIESIDCEEPS